MPSCVAYGCTNASKKLYSIKHKISYHGFPLNNKLLLKIWLLQMRRADFVPSKASRLCSEHFELGCFKYQNFTNRRMIKKDAVPTLFSFRQVEKHKKTSPKFTDEQEKISTMVNKSKDTTTDIVCPEKSISLEVS